MMQRHKLLKYIPTYSDLCSYTQIVHAELVSCTMQMPVHGMQAAVVCVYVYICIYACAVLCAGLHCLVCMPVLSHMRVHGLYECAQAVCTGRQGYVHRPAGMAICVGTGCMHRPAGLCTPACRTMCMGCAGQCMRVHGLYVCYSLQFI